MLKTALHSEHQSLGARMIEFAGWEMPLYYQGILEEHRQTRASAGLFDLGHMGQLVVSGPGAQGFLQWLIPGDLERVPLYGSLYSFLCNPQGGIIDDIILYRREEDFLVVVNGANRETDWEWIQNHLRQWDGTDLSIRDLTLDSALLAIQGPFSQEILSRVITEGLDEVYFNQGLWAQIAGSRAWVSRTGYTGEDGFEIYLPKDQGPRVWEALLGYGATPVGLGARDTLRIEMKYPLHGQEIHPGITPFHAGLGWAVKLEKEGFIGREALMRQEREGVPEILVGLELLAKGVPRPHYPLVYEGERVGEVTSGCLSPSLDKGIAIGYLPVELSQVGTELEMEVRGRRLPIRVAKTPFVPAKVKRKRRSSQ